MGCGGGWGKERHMLSFSSYKVKFIWKLLEVGLILAHMGVLSAEQVSFLPPTKFPCRKLKPSLLLNNSLLFSW